MSKPLRLTYELLSDEAIEHFGIHSKREIQFILQAIAKHGSQVVLYYGNRETFLLTTLVDVDRGGLWLEASQNEASNKSVANSKKFYFVSAHQHVKVQFEATHIEPDIYDGLETFYMTLPHTMLRIQRREHFRLEAPIANPLLCLVPLDHPEKLKEFPILDISSGGIALSCGEQDNELNDEKLYPNCQILLPDNVTIEVTLQVRNMFPVTRPGGKTIKRVGCKFINLDGQTSILLQRYITQLQLDTIA